MGVCSVVSADFDLDDTQNGPILFRKGVLLDSFFEIDTAVAAGAGIGDC